MANSDIRHPMAGLSDELIRLGGRLRVLFAEARRLDGLSDSDFAVLNAVVEADRSPTVPQIGRSLGLSRQVVQRAANSLIAANLIEVEANPDHKRAVLLRATRRGFALKRGVDLRAHAILDDFATDIDVHVVRETTAALRVIRRQLEASLRASNR